MFGTTYHFTGFLSNLPCDILGSGCQGRGLLCLALLVFKYGFGYFLETLGVKTYFQNVLGNIFIGHQIFSNGALVKKLSTHAQWFIALGVHCDFEEAGIVERPERLKHWWYLLQQRLLTLFYRNESKPQTLLKARVLRLSIRPTKNWISCDSFHTYRVQAEWRWTRVLSPCFYPRV